MDLAEAEPWPSGLVKRRRRKAYAFASPDARGAFAWLWVQWVAEVHKTMKLGINASSDIQAAVERCKRFGTNRVMVGVTALQGYQENGYPNPTALQDWKGRLEDEGLEVRDAAWRLLKWPPRPYRTHSLGGITSPEVLLGRDRSSIDAMARMIEVVGQAGFTSVLQIIDICKPIDPVEAEACWDGLIEIYTELMTVAESVGVCVGTHTLHRLLPEAIRERALAQGVRLEDYGSYTAEGWGGPYLVATYKDLDRLINAVPSSSNGVMMCTGMDFLGADIPTLIRQYSDKICCVGFRDSSDLWPAAREVPLGEGRVDFRAVVAALQDVNYQGIWAPEHLGPPRYPGEDLWAKGVAHIESMIESDGV